MSKESWTKVLIDLAATGFLAFLFIVVLKIFGINVLTLTANGVSMLTKKGVNPAEDDSGQGTQWATTQPQTSDSYFGYNYYPPNAVPSGIAPNPLAPASTQTIGGAVGQYLGCTTCGG